MDIGNLVFGYDVNSLVINRFS